MIESGKKKIKKRDQISDSDCSNSEEKHGTLQKNDFMSTVAQANLESKLKRDMENKLSKYPKNHPDPYDSGT